MFVFRFCKPVCDTVQPIACPIDERSVMKQKDLSQLASRLLAHRERVRGGECSPCTTVLHHSLLSDAPHPQSYVTKLPTNTECTLPSKSTNERGPGVKCRERERERKFFKGGARTVFVARQSFREKWHTWGVPWKEDGA